MKFELNEVNLRTLTDYFGSHSRPGPAGDMPGLTHLEKAAKFMERTKEAVSRKKYQPVLVYMRGDFCWVVGIDLPRGDGPLGMAGKSAMFCVATLLAESIESEAIVLIATAFYADIEAASSAEATDELRRFRREGLDKHLDDPRVSESLMCTVTLKDGTVYESRWLHHTAKDGSVTWLPEPTPFKELKDSIASRLPKCTLDQWNSAIRGKETS